MTLEEMKERWEHHDNTDRDWREGHRNDIPPDLHAMLLLHRLAPKMNGNLECGLADMVASAEHDQIWLATDLEALAAVVSDDQIRELVVCGVHYDSDIESLYMFV